MDSTHTVLVIALVLNTALSAAYYLRVIMTMFLGAEEGPAGQMPLSGGSLPVPGTIAMTVAAALLLLFGIFPQHLLGLIERSVR
jgi:NADH:ubiquinone oxidoreductase subunit 2 (subunit N)